MGSHIIMVALLLTGHAAAAEAPYTLSPGKVGETAGLIWAQRHGKGFESRAEGLSEALGAVPGRWAQASASLEPGLALAAADQGAVDHVAALSATLSLGDRPSLQRQTWRARAKANEAEGVAARARFVLAAETAYFQWATASAIAEHLDADVDEYRALIEPLERGVASGGLSRLDLTDLQADLARLSMEALDAWQEVEDAKVQLSRLLGVRLRLEPLPLRLDELPVEAPWAKLVAMAERHPELAALEARALVNREAAKALEASPMQISMGPTLHREDNGFTWAAASVQLTIPLQRAGQPEAASLRGEAMAAEQRRRRQRLALEAYFQAESERHLALTSRYETITHVHLEALEARVSLIREALAAGQATVERLIRARRELHEAEHQRILLAADIHRSWALARRYARLLSGE